MKPENVLVVEDAAIRPYLRSKFNTDDLSGLYDTILRSHIFRGRDLVEDDPGFKQIIPYVLVGHDRSYLLARRGRKQSESRLHDKYSLGIGGHINDCEAREDGRDMILAGLERELSEEIRLFGNRLSLDLVGAILDDSTEVGRVHLGLVYLLRVDSPDYTVQEPDLMSVQWADVPTLRQHYALMESWSQIAFSSVVEKVEPAMAG
ncbi:MAG: hypothetical protein KF833_01250 [Verrucomicrobiae bacterium]|nr:hypothetical protein [Verrucomicrobiae bacterium]